MLRDSGLIAVSSDDDTLCEAVEPALVKGVLQKNKREREIAIRVAANLASKG